MNTHQEEFAGDERVELLGLVEVDPLLADGLRLVDQPQGVVGDGQERRRDPRALKSENAKRIGRLLSHFCSFSTTSPFLKITSLLMQSGTMALASRDCRG